MELFDHIRKISFGFFVAMGLAHFLAGFFFVNGYLSPESGLVNRILFLPFVASGLVYALSNAKYHLCSYGKNSKAWDFLFLVFGITAFLLLLLIEFLVEDSKTTLIPPLLLS
ncbi:hypothetical protein HYV58_00315 [Candidatus Peregrinibacteria bacterium]|nr:hypothetical protein [Candidatus Peregrinibacteria bacterium]